MVNPIVKAKKITDITDQLQREDTMRRLLAEVKNSQTEFEDAYEPRRNELLEINALYRNKSWANSQKTEWQTKTFIPLVYEKTEAKTSMVHEAFWGNRLAAPFTVVGKTSADHAYALSAETYLNNILDTIGFYATSEEGIRACVKYGMAVYRYGWDYSEDEFLWRRPLRNEKGEVERRKDGTAILQFYKKKVKRSQPFVRALDTVTSVGWDPTTKKINKKSCRFVYEIGEETAEEVARQEATGHYLPSSFENINSHDPHGISGVQTDHAQVQLRQDDGLTQAPQNNSGKYKKVYWEGWFDIDGDGKREFIKAEILEDRQILSAEENLNGEYSFVDVQYSRSLHTLTPWGVVDPVIGMQHQINELYGQRGDSIKLILNPQFAFNVDTILEDHSYTSQPGAMHPFQLGEDGDVRRALAPVQFQSLQFVSTNEEDRLISLFGQVTGVSDFNKVLNSSNKDTPASTLFGIFDAQQTTNSMIVNGILSQHGVLGARILKLLRLYGDDKLVLRAAGKRGLEFREESIENLLGDFDVKVTTSAFLGNKNIETQNLIQLRPQWVDAPHINIAEVDKVILENSIPKRVDNILRIPEDPMSPLDEQALFMAGQGESVKLVESEGLGELRVKLDLHKSFEGSDEFNALSDEDQIEWERYMSVLEVQIQNLETQQQLVAEQAAGNGVDTGVNGNITNTGTPQVRQISENIRPNLNQV